MPKGGMVWLTRRSRERRAQEAAERLTRHFQAQMRTAADMAISAARRTAAPGERGQVNVADVLACAHDHFGLVAIPPEQAAMALRARYEYRAGGFDLDTDAYASHWYDYEKGSPRA
jgi:hypothetical protein